MARSVSRARGRRAAGVEGELRACFFDTWAWLALANRRDSHHDQAATADRELEEAAFVAVTSDYILDEALTGLHVAAGPRVALAFLDLVSTSIAAEELLLLEVNSVRRRK